MEEPRTSTACFCLSQDPPTQDSETYAPDDMLCEDPDKKGSGHRDELVHGPETDPFGFIQLPGNHIAIHNRLVPIARLRALRALPVRPHQMNAVTAEVTNGPPVPTPLPPPPGTAICTRLQRPEASAERPSATETIVHSLALD